MILRIDSPVNNLTRVCIIERYGRGEEDDNNEAVVAPSRRRVVTELFRGETDSRYQSAMVRGDLHGQCESVIISAPSSTAPVAPPPPSPFPPFFCSRKISRRPGIIALNQQRAAPTGTKRGQKGVPWSARGEGGPPEIGETAREGL